MSETYREYYEKYLKQSVVDNVNFINKKLCEVCYLDEKIMQYDIMLDKLLSSKELVTVEVSVWLNTGHHIRIILDNCFLDYSYMDDNFTFIEDAERRIKEFIIQIKALYELLDYLQIFDINDRDYIDEFIKFHNL